MFSDFEKLLHPRVIKHCKKLVDDGHYKHAASEAMRQVELALKEKSGVRNNYGVRLTKSLFGQGNGIKLRVPFGEDLQNHAESLFSGAFSYYRNYAVHDGTKIDHIVCLRILIVASELLDLIGASDKSFTDIGGISGLINIGIFENKKQIYDLLHFLEGNILIDHVCDGFFEDLASKGFSDSQLQAAVEIGLVEYISSPYVPSKLDKNDSFHPEELGCFQLTTLGVKIIDSLKQKNT